MIVVVGLSHRTAPIAVREQLAIARDEVPRLLAELVRQPAVAEALVLSTCNRVELVVAPRGFPRAELGGLPEAVLGVVGARAPGVVPHLYAYSGVSAVEHLFRVACSLDSLVVGEAQILGQLKEAFTLARAASTVGPWLNRVFPRALRAAKRVRSETALGAGQVSVPSVAADLARQIFGELRGRAVVLVGSGEMAETTARVLQHAGARLVVVGRNAARTAEVAALVSGQARPWEALGPSLVEADAVITSTSAPHAIIDVPLLSGLRRARRGRSLFLIDLAVPRDVDPRVAELDGAFLYNVDDLSAVVAEGMASRQREAGEAERIVREEVERTVRRGEAEAATPLVKALHHRTEAVLRAELERSLRGRLRGLDAEQVAALEAMLTAASNKLLHDPTLQLRRLAVEEPWRVDAAEEVLAELFDLSARDHAPGRGLRAESAPARAEHGAGAAASEAREEP